MSLENADDLEQRLADYDTGYKARLEGCSDNTAQSDEWRKGWADAKESLAKLP